MQTTLHAVAVALALQSSCCAWAGNIIPVSYDMRNGEASLFTYFDDTYDGSGNRNQSGALLSGGRGDLTDGVIATQSWRRQPALYVGWYSIEPVITFHLVRPSRIERVVLHVDDPNGDGDVYPPSLALIKIDGRPATAFSFADPPSGVPLALTANLGGVIGQQIEITLRDDASRWIMLSEVRFEGYDTDCNADGILDDTQIADRSFADLNGNGVLDACETSISGVTPPSVPAQGGATIQIRGLAFPENPDVRIGNVPATNVSRVSPSLITATCPPLPPGETSVTVDAFVLPAALYVRPECGSDLDQNGVVDAGDISIILLDWGPCYTSMQAGGPQDPPELLANEPAEMPGIAARR